MDGPRIVADLYLSNTMKEHEIPESLNPIKITSAKASMKGDTSDCLRKYLAMIFALLIRGSKRDGTLRSLRLLPKGELIPSRSSAQYQPNKTVALVSCPRNEQVRRDSSWTGKSALRAGAFLFVGAFPPG